MTTVANALIHSFASKYISMLLQLLSTFILARLLTPEHYGLYTISFIFVLLAETIKEFGVGNFLIKEKKLTLDKIRSAFTLLLISSFLIFIVLFFSSYFITEFYSDDRLLIMLQLLSLNVLLTPFGSIIESLCQREMNFKPIFISTLFSQAIGITIMVILAYRGYGEMTLVFGALATNFIKVTVLQFFKPIKNIYYLGIGQLRDVFDYSKYVLLSSIISQVSFYSSELLIGKFYTLELVGLVNRASSTTQLFNRFVLAAINPVVMPYISGKHRKNEDILPSLDVITNVQVNIAWPFFVLLGFLAEPAILILYGSQWLDAAYYLQLYCMGRIISAVVMHLKTIFYGVGEAKSILKVELILGISTIILVVLLIQHSITTMLLGLCTIIPTLRCITYLRILTQKFDITLFGYLKFMRGPLLTTLLVCIPVLIMEGDRSVANAEYMKLVVSVLLAIIIWVFCISKQHTGKVIYEAIK